MTTSAPDQITRLLAQWREGDESALDRLIPLVEHELRRLASRKMRRERAGHTLQTTALVNEAYLRLVDQRDAGWRNRSHFFAIAAQIMRRILIDHARGHQRAKRGGGEVAVPLDEGTLAAAEGPHDLLALDRALTKLAALDARKARVVEMRYFAGLSQEETAEALGVSPNTVTRDWQFARSWLRRELGGKGGGD